MGKLSDALEHLLAAYGPQGWWPLPSRAGTEGRDSDGYLAGHSEPVTGRGTELDAARFEIAVGAVLAQNTAWTGASKAMRALKNANLLSPEALAGAGRATLGEVIRPAGTYRLKAGYLQSLASVWPEFSTVVPSRVRLLSLPGIGFETADCLLLYCFGVPVFIADAYARRIVLRTGIVAQKPRAHGYETLRRFAGSELPVDASYLAEAHALIVEHAKRHCSAKPVCRGCPLAAKCAYALNQRE